MIELFIEGRKIDITENLEISFTYETIDGEKISSIKNSFSKTVNIPGTPNNNITFGHIFRYDKYIPVETPNVNIGNWFDPHRKTTWFLNRNGVLVQRGYCTLDNIIVKNERDITYQFTLYGGIGEFFYSLAYNEDGSVKRLSDLFWNWFPKTNLIGYGSAMDEGEEETRTIYKCSADIVAASYHNLNPFYTYEGTTQIDKDVVFVPCYTGFYDNFDAKHMLVSTFNQRYMSETPFLSADNKTRLENAFPDTLQDNGKTYTTLDRDFSTTSAYRYGLVTFSRDVDAWEAGDLRVGELPVAIRFSKLMTVVSNPINNGGYVVEWDEDIKKSYQWNYGWVLLGKLKQKKEGLNFLKFSPSSTYDGQNTVIDVDTDTGNGTAVSNATPYYLDSTTNALSTGKYNVYLNVFPNLTFKCYEFQRNVDLYHNYISGSYFTFGTYFRYVWTTSVLVHKIYDGNTLLKTVADVFYYTSIPSVQTFGRNDVDVSVDAIKTALNSKIVERFMSSGETIDEFRYHDCKLENPEITGDNSVNTVSFRCSNVQLKTEIDVANDATDFKVQQLQGIFWTNLDNDGLTAGKYGTDAINFKNYWAAHPFGLDSSPFGFVATVQTTLWAYNDSTVSEGNYSWTSFNLNTAFQNGVLGSKTSGFDILQLDKKTLFANSQSPMKYLVGFCKLMNYRFICDCTSKKIQIKTLKNYYVDRTIDINDKVDIGREINIKNISTPTKLINVGLKTAETYPVTVLNRISKDKFNTAKWDTKIEWNVSETNLLDDLTYENTIDWQQNSIYYNVNPQIPKPYNVQSISWTLYNVEDGENVQKKEFFTVGTPSNATSLLSNTDFLPKIALFDKNNKTVDFESSLVFFNGFVKNYDYTDVEDGNGGNFHTYKVISPRVSFSNDTYEQYFLNQERCYIYDFKYNDTFTGWGCYSAEQKGSATSWVLPMFSRDLYNAYQIDFQNWQPAAYKLASWNITNQEGLDNLYSLTNTTFVSNPNYSYTKTTDNEGYVTNEYSIPAIPIDGNDTRIYETYWLDYIDDLTARTNRDVTAYVDLSGFGEPTQLMRYFYVWKSSVWVITKIENYKVANVTNDKFTKVHLHKIHWKSTWTNEN